LSATVIAAIDFQILARSLAPMLAMPPRHALEFVQAQSYPQPFLLLDLSQGLHRPRAASSNRCHQRCAADSGSAARSLAPWVAQALAMQQCRAPVFRQVVCYPRRFLPQGWLLASDS
jgi:hypothetical protein